MHSGMEGWERKEKPSLSGHSEYRRKRALFKMHGGGMEDGEEEDILDVRISWNGKVDSVNN